MNTTDTQKQAIRDWLLLGLTIDPKEAWKRFSCSKIATRVSEISREDNFPTIYKGWKDVTTKFGKTTVRTYSIIPPKKVKL